MTEMLIAAPAKNFVGGEWRETLSGETYEKHNPWRPSEVGDLVCRTAGVHSRVISAKTRK